MLKHRQCLMILLENSSTLLFDSSSTDRKTIDTQLEYQVKIGNAQKIGTPKNLIEAHQTEARIGVSNKANNVAAFVNLNIRKNHVEIDDKSYPRVGVNFEYASNDKLDQY